ncbi:MAG TPA: transglycosylase SLT domain-containing protein [Blastocatellia bacterium]|nr:transglycosylase SLT domain-containing protein [Blastocatellia bacterium]
MNRLFATVSLAMISSLPIAFSAARANTQTFQALSTAEKQAYVKEKAHRIGAAIIGRSSDLSPSYLALVSARVEAYAERIGANTQGAAGQEDFRRVLERGAKYAPVFAKIFQDRNVSPLVGIYLPLMESEYRNELVSQAGSAGMFQFMEQTALRFGLTAEERNDPVKAADAAARYLFELRERFAGDFWLSLLAYNLGERNVEKLLGAVSEARGAACSICVLTEKKDALGKHFQGEGVGYTPALVAAAIIGEHPQDFGVEMRPLSMFTSSK